MKKNKIIPFSLLFTALSFLELFCILKYSDIFYFPLAVGITLLGSAYLLLTEIQTIIHNFIKERDSANETTAFDPMSAEKEENAKLAKATYVLEKRILNLLEERILMPEENMENLSSLQSEIVKAIKASIKYDMENTKQITEVFSNNPASTDNSMSPADLGQILTKFDALALELKSNQLTMDAVKEQLQTITDIARQIANSRQQSAFVEPPAKAETTIQNPIIQDSSIVEPQAEEFLPETENISEETTIETDTQDDMPEYIDTLTITNENNNNITTPEEMPEFVDTLSALDAEPEPEPTKPEPAPIADDPNKKMSPDDIAALFTSASAEPEPEPAKPEPAPVEDDPNKKMSPDDIAALFASASAEPEPEPAKPEPAPVVDDPNKKMSPDDIAALFASANLELDSEPAPAAPKTAIEALSKPAPEPAPAADDPNKKMSPEDIAALFASVGQ
ncbi:MAG: hypothetical protein ACTTG8_04275 [Catonella sp.]|uniref:hypothetical protein n=1 Tax=Catonella sp. TaxID=2382125 RepID=UPI003FA167F4